MTRKKNYEQPTPDQMTALCAYAAAAGDEWKAKLRIDWMRAGTQAVNVETYTFLHQLRNTHGNAWLAKLEVGAAAQL